MKVSVCIPAHNEGRTIARTIQSVLRQSFNPGQAPEMDVIVCASNCRDNTVDEVRRMQREHPGIIRLIEVPEPGKPNAWNALMQAATHELVFFLDGDVEVDGAAFKAMLSLFESECDLILAAGTNAATLRHSSFLTRWTLDRSRLKRIVTRDKGPVYVKPSQDYICGRFYACRRRALLNTLADQGYAKLPQHILHEDAWFVQLLDTAASRRRDIPMEDVILGTGRYWKVCRDAFVYFVPYHWREEARMEARALLADAQLQRVFPDYHAALERIRSRRRSIVKRAVRALHAFLRLSGSARIQFVLRRALSRYVRVSARRIAMRRLTNTHRCQKLEWIRSEASKLPLTVGAS